MPGPHSNFPELESGRAYRFKVRAVNYCSAVDTNALCYGDFSEPTAYTVRYTTTLSCTAACLPSPATFDAGFGAAGNAEYQRAFVPPLVILSNSFSGDMYKCEKRCPTVVWNAN